MKKPEKRRGPVLYRDHAITFVQATGLFVISRKPNGPHLRTAATLDAAKKIVDRLAAQEKARQPRPIFGCEITGPPPHRTFLGQYFSMEGGSDA